MKKLAFIIQTFKAIYNTFMSFVMKLDYKYDKISVISEVQILGNKHGISYQTGEKSYVLSLVR